MYDFYLPGWDAGTLRSSFLTLALAADTLCGCVMTDLVAYLGFSSQGCGHSMTQSVWNYLAEIMTHLEAALLSGQDWTGSDLKFIEGKHLFKE